MTNTKQQPKTVRTHRTARVVEIVGFMAPPQFVGEDGDGTPINRSFPDGSLCTLATTLNVDSNPPRGYCKAVPSNKRSRQQRSGRRITRCRLPLSLGPI